MHFKFVFQFFPVYSTSGGRNIFLPGRFKPGHYIYSDVIKGTIEPQIASLTIVYSTVYSDADKRKHQSSTSLAFVQGIHRGPVNSPHKWPDTRKMFPFWWRHHGVIQFLPPGWRNLPTLIIRHAATDWMGPFHDIVTAILKLEYMYCWFHWWRRFRGAAQILNGGDNMRWCQGREVFYPTLGCYIQGFWAMGMMMGFSVQYCPRWLQDFLAIWLAIPFGASGAHAFALFVWNKLFWGGIEFSQGWTKPNSSCEVVMETNCPYAGINKNLTVFEIMGLVETQW